MTWFAQRQVPSIPPKANRVFQTRRARSERSEQTRVVLIFDIWNPYLTEIERIALADLITEIGAFRETVENA